MSMTSSATPAANRPTDGREARLAGGQRPEPQSLDEHDHQRHADRDGGGLHDPVNPPVADDLMTTEGMVRSRIQPGTGTAPVTPGHGLGLDDQFRRDEPVFSSSTAIFLRSCRAWCDPPAAAGLSSCHA
jgi:hypothetical protein